MSLTGDRALTHHHRPVVKSTDTQRVKILHLRRLHIMRRLLLRWKVFPIQPLLALLTQGIVSYKSTMSPHDLCCEKDCLTVSHAVLHVCLIGYSQRSLPVTLSGSFPHNRTSLWKKQSASWTESLSGLSVCVVSWLLSVVDWLWAATGQLFILWEEKHILPPPPPSSPLLLPPPHTSPPG